MRQSSLTPIAWPAAPRVSNVLFEGGELEDFRQSQQGVEIGA
jgi:hypothetical protein